MDVARVLADFSMTAQISPKARAMMRLSLLDWAACAWAGQNEPVSQIVTAQTLADGGARSALIVGQKTRVPARAAALANGVMSHALDYDDTHFAHIGHPSVAVIPAALAMAEQVGANGGALLDAALIGAEASIRFGVWLGRGHYQAGFHQTGTAGQSVRALLRRDWLGLGKYRRNRRLGWFQVAPPV